MARIATQRWAILTSFLLSAQIDKDSDRKLMRIGQKTSELASCGVGPRGRRLGLAWGTEWSRMEPGEKSLYEPCAGEAKDTYYSAAWDAHLGVGISGLPYP